MRKVTERAEKFCQQLRTDENELKTHDSFEMKAKTPKYIQSCIYVCNEHLMGSLFFSGQISQVLLEQKSAKSNFLRYRHQRSGVHTSLRVQFSFVSRGHKEFRFRYDDEQCSNQRDVDPLERINASGVIKTIRFSNTSFISLLLSSCNKAISICCCCSLTFSDTKTIPSKITAQFNWL